MTERDDQDDGSATEVEPESENTDGNQADAPGGNVERDASTKADHRINWLRVLAYGVLPGLTLLLAVVTGYSKWQLLSDHAVQRTRAESLAAAKDSTIAILSYQPDSVDKSLVAARDRLLPPYRDAYIKLTDDVVIPGARRDRVSVTATVPAASSVSATPTHAVAILFVNQAAAMGTSPPTTTVSSIRVTLEKTRGRWLISGFDPI
jgi:Mce-associated membrane protein